MVLRAHITKSHASFRANETFLFDSQLLLLPLLMGQSVWSLMLSNTLYAVAFSVYFYITHLGYRCEYCVGRRRVGPGFDVILRTHRPERWVSTYLRQHAESFVVLLKSHRTGNGLFLDATCTVDC